MSDEVKKRNWFARHKILTVILAFVLILIIGGALGGGDSKTTTNSDDTKTTTSNAKTYRFTERADKQTKDVELLPNESATVGGVKLTVTSVEYATSLGMYDNASSGKTYLVAGVQLENTSSKTQPYNQFDFRVQTAGGQVLDSTVVISITDLLNSGDLVAGGKATGKVVFQVPVEEGHQYLIWKPGFGSERAIIQTK